ncbi:hypothetical protein CBE90_04640 [Pasteurella multocida]|nr:hypothetical protein CBE90_04640 [Pasteurella multocida]PPE95048.1 hypothetical protein CBE91_10330 [Pasteurella multocida]
MKNYYEDFFIHCKIRGFSEKEIIKICNDVTGRKFPTIFERFWCYVLIMFLSNLMFYFAFNDNMTLFLLISFVIFLLWKRSYTKITEYEFLTLLDYIEGKYKTINF